MHNAYLMKTPFYYYDLELLRKTLETINGECTKYDNYFVHYAVKANANPQILKVIKDSGLGIDCVSGGEIQAALDAGFDPGKIVFAGVGKADWEINLGLDNDIFCFNAESTQELEVINELAAAKGKTATVCLRVNPNVDAHTHSNIATGMQENKFGISDREILNTVNFVQKLQHLRLRGLHFHIGSQILDMVDFRHLCSRINEITDMLHMQGLHLDIINVGGGLGIDYDEPEANPIPDFKGYFETYDKYLRRTPGQEVHFELGRSVVAQCGSLITKVLYVKEAQIKRFAIVDAGMTDLIRPALYQAHHKIVKLNTPHNRPLNSPYKYDVVGPICESSDVFDTDVELPEIHRGDFLAILSAGAYGEIMASHYNCRSLPGSITSDVIADLAQSL